MILYQYRRLAKEARLVIARTFHSTRSICSPQQSPLYKLRQKTGLAYSLCREALVKHDNDINEAEAWLKAQELAHGLQKATKVRGRSAKEGLIGLAVAGDYKVVSVLELNCETDFVAKNQIFKDFAMSLTEQFAGTRERCEIYSIDKQKFVQELRPTKDELSKIDEQIVPLITKLGENIKIHKATHFQAKEDDILLFGQVHAQAGKASTANLNMMTGRFGAIVGLQQSNRTESKALSPIGNRLCQHVIGYSPSYIELPENIRIHLESAEKDRLESMKNVENDCEAEEYSDSEREHEEQNNRDDWPSMMDQSLIMSDSGTVRDFCKENEVTIVYFNRFECGEGSQDDR